jgi:hypothetical protein
MTAIVCGVISAAPKPCTSRATMSISTVEVRPHQSEASEEAETQREQRWPGSDVVRGRGGGTVGLGLGHEPSQPRPGASIPPT